MPGTGKAYMIEMNCTTCGKLLRIPSEYAGVIGRCNGCGEPVQVPGLPRLDGPPNPPALSSSDLTTPAPIQTADTYTRDEAIAIDVAVSQREMARAHKDMAAELRKATLMSRLTCGCLLVTLTAPIWITGLVFFATMGFTAAVAAIATFFGLAKPVGIQPDPLPVIVVHEPEPVAAAPKTEPEPVPPPLTMAVYSDGARYHFDINCQAIVGSGAPALLQTALERGKQPCPTCAPEQPYNPVPLSAPPVESHPDDPVLSIRQPIVEEDQVPIEPDEQSVYSSSVDEKYHKANCANLPKSAVAMTLSAAQVKGRTACAHCKPPR